MMKRIVLVLVAALMMGGVAMAQRDGGRRGDKAPDAKARAEQMTERMAKEYSLTDAQKQQLLEANTALMEKMGDMPPMPSRRHDMKKGKDGCDSCSCQKGDKPGRPDGPKGERPELTDEQKAQMKTDMEKKKAGMEEVRAAYDAQLKQILTPEQYEAYTQKMKDRKPGRMEKRR